MHRIPICWCHAQEYSFNKNKHVPRPNVYFNLIHNQSIFRLLLFGESLENRIIAKTQKFTLVAYNDVIRDIIVMILQRILRIGRCTFISVFI